MQDIKKPVLQKIKQGYSSELELAVRYYSIFSIIKGFNLNKRQIQLLAYTATKGNISSGPAKSGFVEIFGSTKDTLDNLISQLYRKKLLVKEDKKIFVRKEILLDFSNRIRLQLDLKVNVSTEG